MEITVAVYGYIEYRMPIKERLYLATINKKISDKISRLRSTHQLRNGNKSPKILFSNTNTPQFVQE